jgi:hypothetical protein
MIAELSDRFLRAASLVVTDRRWAATLSATALGFGLFVGVAIGPGAAGTVASGAQRIVMPSPSGATSEGRGRRGRRGSVRPRRSAGGGGGGGEEAFPSEPLPPASEPFIPLESEPPPPAEEPAPAKAPTPTAEEPAGVEATELKGTVVHANPAAGSYALAIKGGELVPVHAGKLPQAGAKLTVDGLQLANGTFSEQEKPKSSGKATQATLRGVVTFVKPDPLAPAYTVSGRGASLLVQVSPDPAGAVPPLPVLGARVTVDAAIEAKGVLRQQKLEIEAGEPSAYLDLSGIYNGTHPETGQLLLSADDTRASEADLAFTVGPKVEIAKLRKGDSYLATAEIAEDGSLRLMGIASDEKLKGADDPKAAQGDLKR